ncbi:MAG: tyrosine-type recombinase/integrase, partial [Alphaproteobacteria bacterium]|nr:tyrosine-type recombinase/integrase [Alphaproteobacteria bacterium]
SPQLILAFLHHLEQQRKNSAKTRNHRLAVIKSLAKMIRLMYPDQRQMAQSILRIPQKRVQKKLIGFLYPDEMLSVLNAVDLKKSQGLRDYCILQLLYDAGLRASELATLNLDYFDPTPKTLAILGKGNRYRQVQLLPITCQLLEIYIAQHRINPKPLHQQRLFINQRKEGFTRHGIYRICRKYLSMALSEKRIKQLNAVHSLRHACAIRMLACGDAVTDIRNKLGHENVESSMVYLRLDPARKKHIQQQFVRYTQSLLPHDPNIDKLIDWKNKKDIMHWLDSL